MKLVFKLISLLFLITACQEPEHIPEAKNELVFKTNFEAGWTFSGSFIDAKTHVEYVYFTDPESSKCIKFFKLTGEMTDSIPLTEALRFLKEIDGIAIRAKDTIVLNSKHTNLISVIDSKGKRIKNTVMDSIIKQANGDHYELYTTFFEEKLIGNSILFFNEFRYNDHDTVEMSKLEDELYIRKNMFNAPYFCKISNYSSGTPKAQFGLKGFYAEFAKPTDNWADVPRYTCLNNKIFLWTTHSNKLFIVNPNTLTLENKIEIKSRYTPVGNAKPIPINNKTINRFQELSDSIYYTSSQPQNLLYDAQHASYYFFIYHATQSLEKEIGYKRMPYSIIKIDTSFTKFTEYKMNADSFFGAFSIMTSQGLIINKPSKNVHESNTYTKFTRFEFKD